MMLHRRHVARSVKLRGMPLRGVGKRLVGGGDGKANLAREDVAGRIALVDGIGTPGFRDWSRRRMP